MMSSEEDTAECFGLYGDKLLSSKKSKRTRQRVDAGEPRNSYSSIPNFSSRPSFMSGGLYGALLSQSQQHFGGLFGPNGFGSAKMLNELFGRQVKSAQDASSGPESMLSMESASSTDGTVLAGTVAVGANSTGGGSASGKLGFESAASSNNSSPVIRRRTSSSGVETDGGGSTPPQQTAAQQQQQQNELAHHMLRNILQGKKEQLMALDHELRSVAAAAAHNSSPDNNNSISKNNNNTSSNNNNNNTNTVNSNNSTNSSVKCSQQDVKSEMIAGATKVNNSANASAGGANKQQQHKAADEVGSTNNGGRANSSTGDFLDENNSEHDGEDLMQSERIPLITKKERDDLIDEDDEMMGLNNSHSDLESLGSGDSVAADDVQMKEEMIEADLNLDKELERTSPMNQGVGGGGLAGSGKEPVALDMKRARVENIVSTMRSSPSLGAAAGTQVNGCKKRKLYQPQQHDNSAAERYAAVAAGLNLNLGLNLHGLIMDEDDDDDLESPHIQQKRDEKNALKSQLRSMQEQLAEMQQKYVQLCSRMEQESECQEIDDTGSDIIEQDVDQDDNNDDSPTPTIEKSQPERSPPPVSPLKELTSKSHNNNSSSAPNMLSQMMSKMMSSNKLRNPLGGHHHMPQTFNGTHPLLQHMHHGALAGDHGMPNPHMSHHAISNAAAMYLGQKFFLEQEARLAKEAAEHHERQQQQQHHQQQQHQHHHLQQQQQQQQLHHQPQQTSSQQSSSQQSPAQTSQSQQQQQSQNQSQSAPPSQSQQSSESSQSAGPGHHMQHPHHQPHHHHHSSQTSASAPSSTQPQSMRQSPMTKLSTVQSEISEKFNIIRSSTNSVGPMSGTDLEGLADILKLEITASLSTLVDSIVTRFVHQRRYLGKQSEAAAAATAEQLNKDLLLASQLLDRKSPRIKVADRSSSSSGVGGNNNSSASNTGNSQSGNGHAANSINIQTNSSVNHSSIPLLNNQNAGQRLNGSAFPPMGLPMHVNGSGPGDSSSTSSLSSLNIPPHVRPSPSAAMFQAPKPPQPMNAVAAAALYNSMNALGGHGQQVNPFCMPEPRDQNQEQNEALSLVVTPKKKRHKVTDTRITPRTVSRILAQDGIGPNSASQMEHQQQQHQQHQQQHQQQMSSNNHHPKFSQQQVGPGGGGPGSNTPVDTPSPRSSYHPPPPPPAMMPVSLPTSVAIPNPSLHESQVFSPYSPFFTSHGPHGPHGPHTPQHSQLHHVKMSSSPPGLCGMMDSRDSPPLPHPQTMLHPALLAAAHHSGSPDYGHLRAAMDTTDRSSDCNSGDISFDGIQPTSSTLTPMHLRKAKLMFFWVRYPSSAVLKMYFPDIKFNKNNTAQLVKWFSNFREFYYIQMEKYARQAITEGVKNADDLHVSGDSELYRVLNLHYNRNNHIEVCRDQVPTNFRFVIEQTLREFFRAIQSGKDAEQSWKKSIYKIISRLDDPVPEYFKSPNFLEQLE